MNYYNEWDKGAAAWLRELIKHGHIPFGVVDERSITEVKPEDLDGFTQCHFFAGIGGWPLALRLAGVSEDTPLWTGSPPCQPFSAAGKQLGQFDPRHLAPVFLDLISECRPPVLFGEQVAPAIAKSWMCDLQTHLEGEDYAVGFAVLPACSVGAPHKRERLFFGAKRMVHADREHQSATRYETRFADACRTSPPFSCMASAISCRRQQQPSERPASICGKEIQQAECELQSGDARTIFGESTNPHHGYWSDADWLGCRDGKFRPVEPGTFPLANGIPARVGRLRGYGNAIVPQVAAEFIKAFMGAVNE
ncbi:DNA cytosine methyltransferase [Escherichia coli]|uniref:DNA cytosine methyltransferase n=1 Tax=Escherichia coli TaxID=562 RepID=UPI0010CC455C|nr:DNA cytosine methyltransferase [Escherichia coli]